MDVQGELADAGGGLGPSAVRRALRLPGGRREPAQPQEGRTSAHPQLQQERRLVRGALSRPGGVGAVQLRDPRQLAGEALLVPRAHLPQRGRVPAQLGHQRQLPGSRVRELTGAAQHLAPLRGPRLPLPH